MSSKITGKEYPLLKIFSSDFEYHIPAYQRPYAWTAEETGILFDDLYEFYRMESNDNDFLGTIVLIKEDDKPRRDEEVSMAVLVKICTALNANIGDIMDLIPEEVSQ